MQFCNKYKIRLCITKDGAKAKCEKIILPFSREGQKQPYRIYVYSKNTVMVPQSTWGWKLVGEPD